MTHERIEQPVPAGASHHLLAVIDDAAGVRDVVHDLSNAGVPAALIARVSDNNGVRQLDATTGYTGRLTRIVRGRPTLSLEGNQLDCYAMEVEQGHHVLDVAVYGRRVRDRIVAILREHGAHFINAYGVWTIEQVAA